MKKNEIIETIRNYLAASLKAIYDLSNYAAMFGHTVATCAAARDFNRLLFELGGISDEEFRTTNVKIEEARKQMILTHGQWTARFLGKRKDRHTVQTLVSSIYHDIFGIEIKK